ncbi:MAG: PqqD family protein [Clostridiales bacterium]|nr:PqqD family protein [Clostridiales bacterium]
MKIKPGFILRDIDGQSVVIPVGAAARFNGMITLRGTGKFLWTQLQSDQTEQTLLAAVLATYEVPEETAAADIQNFLIALRDAELLCE